METNLIINNFFRFMHSSFKSDHVVVFLLTEHVVFKHVTKGSVADWIGYLGAWYDGRKQASKL